MSTNLNPQSTKYGIDVATRRADDLDKKLIDACKYSETPSVIDIGCGSGGLIHRLTEHANCIVGIDIVDYQNQIAQHIIPNSGREKVSFICGDALEVISGLKGKNFDYAVIQRMIHYLPNDEAKKVLKEVRKIVTSNLYISASEIDSEIGTNYKDKTKAVEKRFCTLIPEDSNKFSINAPLCLYKKEEFVELLESTGWKIDECWESAFKNIKAICS